HLPLLGFVVRVRARRPDRSGPHSYLSRPGHLQASPEEILIFPAILPGVGVASGPPVGGMRASDRPAPPGRRLALDPAGGTGRSPARPPSAARGPDGRTT